MKNIMRTTIYFAIFFTVLRTCWADIPGECNMYSFYMELGCTALPKVDNSTNCPDAFQCPDLHPNPEKCFYRGLPYEDRTMLPQSLIDDPCTQACSCNVADGPRFDCAAVDCVESFDSDELNECIYTFELDACCSTGKVCGKDAIASLKTCEVDGQTYKEGQIIEPTNTRKTCICTANWNGSFEDPTTCKNITCGLEIHYQDKIMGKCAPVFFGNMKSCPISFECPSNSSKIIRGLNLRSVPEQCTFGNYTLSVGDSITVDEKCTKCKCEVPPLISCIKKNSCDEQE